MHDDTRLCAAIRKDGSPCRLRALPQQTTCWGHDPARAATRKLGGLARANARRAAKSIPRDLAGVNDVLLKALHDCATGTLDPHRASALSSLAGALVRLHQAGEVEQRLRDLENRAEVAELAARGNGLR